MDPDIQALVEVLEQINQLSGSALDALLKAGGEGGSGAPPAPAPEGATPAPPEA